MRAVPQGSDEITVVKRHGRWAEKIGKRYRHENYLRTRERIKTIATNDKDICIYNWATI